MEIEREVAEARILRELRERHPGYTIGHDLAHQRFYAYGTVETSPHTLITGDLTELARELDA